MIDIFIRNHSFSVFCDRQKLFDANILKFRRFLLTLQQVKSNGPVAQLNRASDSGSECRGFESHRGHTTKGVCQNDASSFFTNKAPTFTSQGFVMSKRFCTFRH